MLHVPPHAPRAAALQPEQPRAGRTTPIEGPWRGVVLAALALAASACGPRIAAGPAPLALSEEPVSIEVIEDTAASAPRIEVLLLAAGSRWDPPGQEGRSAVALLSPRNPVGVAVHREHAWLVAECTGGDVRCVSDITRTLSGEPWLESELDIGARRYWVDQQLLATPDGPLATDLLFGVLFEAHPYAHAPLGRHGTLPAITRAQIGGFFRENVRRSTVRARVVAPSAGVAQPIVDSLAASLGALPAGLPPDPAMKGPPPAAGVLAVGVAAGDDAVATLGVALPRRATQTTRAMPTPEAAATWRQTRACAGAALAPELQLVDDDHAPDGWDDVFRAPAHASLVWTATGAPDLVREALTAVPARLAALPDDGECAQVNAELAALLAPGSASAVVLWPSGIEDPWPGFVQAGGWTQLVRLPPTAQERLR